MNRVCLIGRLTKDIELRYSQSGVAFASFTLAVNRKFKKEGEQQADFISCKVFGKTAEFMEKYMQKGLQIAVEGRIQTGSYTNKDGQKVYTTDVMVENAYFADKKGDGGGNKGDAYESEVNMNSVDAVDLTLGGDPLPF